MSFNQVVTCGRHEAALCLALFSLRFALAEEFWWNWNGIVADGIFVYVQSIQALTGKEKFLSSIDVD